MSEIINISTLLSLKVLCNIKTITQSTNRFSFLSSFEDVISKELQLHIVHKYLCGNYNVTYYGNTKRHFNVRSSKHFGIAFNEKNGRMQTIHSVRSPFTASP